MAGLMVYGSRETDRDRAEPRCPHCGSILRVDAGRIVARELLFWAAVALAFAFLWASGGTRELYALLAAVAFIGWFWRRLRRPALWCAQCRRAGDL